jgi:hypothetical protein
LRPLGPAFGTGGNEWSAALASDYIRRGYPVIALVRPAYLPDSAPDTDGADRYIVLFGLEGNALLYHDPGAMNGVKRRVQPPDLDQAWGTALPPFQGVALGFGTNTTGLLAPSRTTAANATTVPTATPLLAQPSATPQIVAAPQPADPIAGGAFFPGLMVFLAALAAGIGFVVARLLR